ncbi:hypothetical protein SGFS_025910 [Streptomyces graminofaciens]|uniref:Integral membrane protein n=1 Tax=Streptomyces graminofaciens TaxID=68212 RepID=A0ABN5VDH9_9ACTN|nr:hypothetical protein [Streptomyces graminofaciens]BBC31297.1 hypothetical protein SGFS_025910 [Streptomyces graminofaciens]
MHQPITTLSAPLPVLRAVVFAVVGTVLGASAHLLLAEGPVPWAKGAVATAALFGLGLVGTRRPRSLATVAVGSVAAQSGLHLWLTLTTHARHAVVTTAAGAGHQGGHGGHTHDLHAAWYERLHGSAAMSAAHALVAVLVAVLLHRADAACWTLTRGATAALDTVRAHLAAVRALVAGRPPAPQGIRLPVLVFAEGERPPGMSPVLAYAVVRRGPPSTRPALVN